MACAAHDLNLWLLSKYSIEPMAREGLVIGYGDHDEPALQDTVRRLVTVMQAVWPKAAATKVVP